MIKWCWNLIEKISYCILKKIFSLLNKELSEETFKAMMQFIKFGIVGVSNTLVSYVVYFVSLLEFRKFHWFGRFDYLYAQIVAFLISVLWAFYWNNKYVFTMGENEERSLWKVLLKTYATYSFTGLFLNGILLYLWVDVLHISEFLAPILNIFVNVPLNFIINKFWAFKSERKEQL